MESSINLALAQMDVEPARPDVNAERMLNIMEEQRRKGTQLLVFPEMCIPGYMIGDRWGSREFVEDALSYNSDIAAASKDMVTIWGNVAVDPTKMNFDGTVRKYNAAYVAQDGKVLPEMTTYKTLLPTYRQFHDRRHFASLLDCAREEGKTIEEVLSVHEVVINEIRYQVGLILCEDMWWNEYGINVADILRRKGAEFIVNISCSPWGLRKADKRHRVVKELFPTGEGIPFVYVNNAGYQDIGKTTFSFDGRSCIYDRKGNPVVEGRPFEEMVLEEKFFPREENPIGHIAVMEQQSEIAEIKRALIYGIRQFFSDKNRPQRVVIGLSGGIDSSVNAALFTEALGPDRIFGINMPTRHNKEVTKSAAAILAKNLRIHYAIAPIQEAFDGAVQRLEQVVFEGPDGRKTPITLDGLDRQNAQARIRGSEVLAGLAANLKAVISLNSNKTETAFGYFTLYGDNIGALGPIGDLLKGQVYDVGYETNRQAGRVLIPQESFDVTPSAELEEDQVDPFWYPYHDQLVKHWVEGLLEPGQILDWFKHGVLDEKCNLPQGAIIRYFGTVQRFIEDLEHKWNLFQKTVFKRYINPPVIKVSSRSFGYDFHESQVSPHLSRKYLRLKEELLSSAPPHHNVLDRILVAQN